MSDNIPGLAIKNDPQFSASRCRTAHGFLHVLTYITDEQRYKSDTDWEKNVDLRSENVKNTGFVILHGLWRQNLNLSRQKNICKTRRITIKCTKT